MRKIIEIKDLMVAYDDRVIIKDISFDIDEGEILCIVGGSGCGKSTLLKQIIGLEVPNEGTIFVDGEELTNADRDKKKEILRKFGILFQSSGLFASMTLAENIALPLRAYTPLNEETIDDIIDIKLEAVGLSGFRDYLPNEISGGMKKRAALARAMALDPVILCFDEPSSGLDPVSSASLDALIKEIKNDLGTTMIVVTHDLESIFSIADRVVLLDKELKGIRAIGTPEELRENKEDTSIYNFFNRIGKK